MVPSSCLLAALLVGGMSAPVAGLTVYRLGGRDLPPPPEVEVGEADFVQFDWADLDPDLQGTSESLTIEAMRGDRVTVLIGIASPHG